MRMPRPGRYWIGQLSAPDGYAPSPWRLPFAVRPGREVDIAGMHPAELANFSWVSNRIEPPLKRSVPYDGTERAPIQSVKEPALHIRLTDLCGNGLPGGQAMLRALDAPRRRIATANSQGELVFQGIPAGRYLLCENRSPSGHARSLYSEIVEIIEDGGIALGDANVAWEHHIAIPHRRLSPVDGLRLQIVACDTGRPLARNAMTLTDAGGRPVALQSPDDAGVVCFGNLLQGEYNLIQTSWMHGYRPYSRSMRLIVHGDSGMQLDGMWLTGSPVILCNPPVRWTHPAGKLALCKRNHLGEPVRGAGFTLYQQCGAPMMQRESRADGWLVFEGIAPGDYSLKETSAARGYLPIEETLPVRVDARGRTWVKDIVAGEFLNFPLVNYPTGISFYKLDGLGKPIAGAHFALQDGIGQTLCSVCSAETGLISIQALTPGEYRLAQLHVPAPYSSSGPVQRIMVKPDGQLEPSEQELTAIFMETMRL